MRKALPISQITALGRFPGCVLAGGTQAKPGGLPVSGKWTWESEKAKVGRVCRVKHWRKGEQHTERTLKTKDGPFSSLQLSTDQCIYVRKLQKGREKCNINS